MVVHAYNPSIREMEIGRFLGLTLSQLVSISKLRPKRDLDSINEVSSN